MNNCDKFRYELPYINKYQIEVIKKIAPLLPNKIDDVNVDEISGIANVTKEYMSQIFGSYKTLFEMAYCINPPNKISLVIEFEKIKNKIHKIPHLEDVSLKSKIDITGYVKEFGTWEKFLNKLEYDPWYKETATHTNKKYYSPYIKKLEQYDDDVIDDNLIDDKKIIAMENIINRLKNNDVYFKQKFTQLMKYIEIMPRTEINKIFSRSYSDY